MAIRPFRTTGLCRGFTLVETLVYIAAMVLLLGAMTAGLIQMNSWYHHSATGPRIDGIGAQIIEQILRDIRSGTGVGISESRLDVTDGALFLDYKTASTEGTKLFNLENGRIAYAENGSPIGYISPADVTISKLRFSYISTQNSKAVRIETDISFAINGVEQSRTYSGVAVLRNSYD